MSSGTTTLSPKTKPLIDLGKELLKARYEFVTPTPETHRRVLDRFSKHQTSSDLRDVFGWNREFKPDSIPPALIAHLKEAGCLHAEKGHYRSRVRYSTLDGGIYVHSSYPTESEDSVFFGPDTYRFVRFLKAVGIQGGSLVDIGAGAGPGGLSCLEKVDSVTLADVNPLALLFSQVNASLAEADSARIQIIQSAGLDNVQTSVDWILANPPFIVDAGERTYRNGGDQLGAALSLKWAADSMVKLKVGGHFVMYTASAIVRGHDQMKHELHKIAKNSGAKLSYEEIDPDIFGEELENEAYSSVERLAAVGVVLSR